MSSIKEKAQAKIDENIETNKVNLMVNVLEQKAVLQSQLVDLDNDAEKIENAKTIEELKSLSHYTHRRGI